MSEELGIAERLKQPFPVNDIEWRVSRVISTRRGPKATVLAYVTARAIMDRLDEVFGVDGWSMEYQIIGEDRFLCTISCRINGEWVSKTDGANSTQVEPFKGGISDSLKRAAVPWGIGRYLYNLSEAWVDIYGEKPDGVPQEHIHYVDDKKNGVKGYWITPELPDWAQPFGAPAPVFVRPPVQDTSSDTPSDGGEKPARKASYPVGKYRYSIPYKSKARCDELGIKARRTGDKTADGKDIWEQHSDEFFEEFRAFCKNPPATNTDSATMVEHAEPYGAIDDDDDIPF